ncbi:hypothetical protein BDQ12DRAFT_690057 [Crucibulum laeve]|uniref:N-acetyltransferase domain-containing protein n=1 Tax=Crucibulum laeve TaxID=68775 RepID=A0A5C3LN39_9AGAR|nr:hypothetical protein BDQ12DRAFT_690057 [Crucibulum laeve]
MSLAVRCATKHDIPQATAILNHYIEHTIITFRTELLEPLGLLPSFVDAELQGLPFLVGVDTSLPTEKQVLGYAYALLYNPKRGGYRHTAEISIYLHPEHRSQGLGTMLMKHLFVSLKTPPGPRCGPGETIDAPPPPLIKEVIAVMALKTDDTNGGYGLKDWYGRWGFVQVGHLKRVGFKFEKWIDDILLQVSLDR